MINALAIIGGVCLSIFALGISWGTLKLLIKATEELDRITRRNTP